MLETSLIIITKKIPKSILNFESKISIETHFVVTRQYNF